jgi:ferredoxin
LSRPARQSKISTRRTREETLVKVRADNQVCEAHGQCYLVDEELFTVDDDGYSTLGGGVEVPPGKEDIARLGVDSCPVQALHIE